ncbi:MAG: hypothetical protein JNK87_00030 [Bryobacterales bacterium]|nr:hypothetical protein [Bryobacterales bacterium]
MLRYVLPSLLTLTLQAESVGTASRTVTLPPEEIVVELVISTHNEIQPEQAVALLSALQVSAADLKTVGTLRDDIDKLGWQFTFVRPYSSMRVLVKQLEQVRGQLREAGTPMSYQFFLRPSPRTLETTRRKVLSELVNEARQSAGAGSSKIRSFSFEPRPETLDSGRTNLLFGQHTGALQYQFTVTAVFE